MFNFNLPQLSDGGVKTETLFGLDDASYALAALPYIGLLNSVGSFVAEYPFSGLYLNKT